VHHWLERCIRVDHPLWHIHSAPGALHPALLFQSGGLGSWSSQSNAT